VSGGCFDVRERGSFAFTNSVFNHCGARLGAAVVERKDASGSLSSCCWHSDSALASGGMVCVGTDPTVAGGEFVENKAGAGAGTRLAEGRLLTNSSVFSGGYASDRGGAVDTSGGSHATSFCATARLTAAALCGRARPAAVSLRVPGGGAKADGGGLRANESSSFLCSGCSFTNNSADGDGGGACSDSEAPRLLARQLDDAAFELDRLGSEVWGLACDHPRSSPLRAASTSRLMSAPRIAPIQKRGAPSWFWEALPSETMTTRPSPEEVSC